MLDETLRKKSFQLLNNRIIETKKSNILNYWNLVLNYIFNFTF